MVQKEMVLIVDDDADARMVLSLYLHKLGFDVHEASDGEEAVGKTKAIDPSLVIIDQNLPGLTGLATFEAMRQNGYENLALILTAYGKITDALLAVEAGFFGHVEKPVSQARLEIVVLQAMKFLSLKREVRQLHDGGALVIKKRRVSPSVGSLAKARTASEKEYLKRLIALCKGDIQAAIKESGISRSSLYEKLKTHSLL